jgi:hypothetical protein
MNPDPLERQLEAYAQQSVPAAPVKLAEAVWNEIERRRSESLAARLGWHELLKRPAWALAGLAFALAVGAMPAVAFSRLQQARQLARDSLHFEVFAPHPRGQIATLLAHPENSRHHSP